METPLLITSALWVIGIFTVKFAINGDLTYKLVKKQSPELLKTSYEMLEEGEISEDSDEQVFLSGFTSLITRSMILFVCQSSFAIYLILEGEKGLVKGISTAILYLLCLMFGISCSYKKSRSEENIFKVIQELPKWLRLTDRLSLFALSSLFLILVILSCQNRLL